MNLGTSEYILKIYVHTFFMLMNSICRIFLQYQNCIFCSRIKDKCTFNESGNRSKFLFLIILCFLLAEDNSFYISFNILRTGLCSTYSFSSSYYRCESMVPSVYQVVCLVGNKRSEMGRQEYQITYEQMLIDWTFFKYLARGCTHLHIYTDTSRNRKVIIGALRNQIDLPRK